MKYIKKYIHSTLLVSTLVLTVVTGIHVGLFQKPTVASAASATTFNIKDFGAKGDCSTDDTAAIQSAINAAVSAGGSTVFIPAVPNCYKVTSGITINGRVSIIGEGWEAKNITASGGSVLRSSVATGDLFIVNKVSGPLLFRDIAIGSTYPGKISGAAVTFSCVGCGGWVNSGTLFDHIAITDYPVSVDIKDGSTMTIQNSLFANSYINNATAINVGNRENTDGGEFTITDNIFRLGNGGIGINYVSGGGMRFLRNRVSGGAIGFRLTSQSGVPFQSGQMIISHSTFEGQTQHGIQARNANTADVLTDSVIYSNTFRDTTGSVKHISMGGSNANVYQNITMVANDMHTIGIHPAIEMFSSSNINVTGNVLKTEGRGTAIWCQGTVNFGQAANILDGWGANIVGCQ